MGKYFSASSPYEQLQWILGSEQLPHIEDETILKFVNVDDFNKMNDLLGDRHNQQVYIELGKFLPMIVVCKKSIAFVVLTLYFNQNIPSFSLQSTKSKINFSFLIPKTEKYLTFLTPCFSVSKMSKIADLDLDHNGIIAALILYNPRTVFQSQSKNRSKNEFCDKKLVNITFDTVAESCLRIPEYSQVAEAICNHDDFSDILNLMRKIVQVSVCIVIEKNYDS